MKFGKLCQRCGECCLAVKCGVGAAIFERETPCPAIEQKGSEYACGLVLNPSKYVDLGSHAEWKNSWFSDMVKWLLGIGLGCCSSHEGKRLSHEMRKARIRHSAPADTAYQIKED